MYSTLAPLNGTRIAAPLANMEAELNLLGSLIHENGHRHFEAVARIVTPRQFVDPQARKLAQLVWELLTQGKPLSVAFVAAEIRDRNLVDELAGLLNEASYVPTAERAVDFAENVRATWARRYAKEMLGIANERIDDGEDSQTTMRELADAIQAEADQQVEHDRPSLRPVRLDDLDAAEPPAAPKNFLGSYLPAGCATLLASHGGGGKTILALIIAAHVATGRDLFGFPTQAAKVLFLSLEDPGDIIRWRLAKICREYDLSPEQIASNLMIIDGTSGLTELMTETRESGTSNLIPTATFSAVKKLMTGHQLLIVDNVSDAFGANENERRNVRRFVRALVNLVGPEGAVLLLAHIDKAAARGGSSGNTYSGSTGWHNSVRSRLALIDDKGAIELRHEKANLTKRADPIALKFNDLGVLIQDGGGVAWSVLNDTDDADLIEQFKAAEASGKPISTAQTGATNAHKVLRDRTGFPPRLKPADAFWRAIARLESTGKLTRTTTQNEYRNPREVFTCGDCGDSELPRN